jgi:hypothetical protein
MKFLVWFLLGLLVYWALRSQARRHQNKRNAASERAQPTPKSSKPIEKMVACSYCQIYLPTSEAIHLVDGSSEHYFCSEEHAKLYKNNEQ